MRLLILLIFFTLLACSNDKYEIIIAVQPIGKVNKDVIKEVQMALFD